MLEVLAKPVRPLEIMLGQPKALPDVLRHFPYQCSAVQFLYMGQVEIEMADARDFLESLKYMEVEGLTLDDQRERKRFCLDT